jgi:hypothetical protein
MITVNFIDNDTVEIPGAVRVQDRGNGQISIKLLTSPLSSWVDQNKNKVPYGASFTVGAGEGAFENLFDVEDNWNMDPHTYVNGNKMSIAESVTRATDKVYDDNNWWGAYTDYNKGNKKDLAHIVYVLIKDAVGRNEVYRLGARAATMWESGTFDRYTLVDLFQLQALLDGLIDSPVFNG